MDALLTPRDAAKPPVDDVQAPVRRRANVRRRRMVMDPRRLFEELPPTPAPVPPARPTVLAPSEPPLQAPAEPPLRAPAERNEPAPAE